MTVVLRRLLSAAAVCCSFFPGATLRAAESTNSELPAVAADSLPNLERAPEARGRSKDERWLNRPFHVGLSTILGETPGLDYVFLMPGVELSYALPYVSLGGTLGYLGGINASLAARGRLHLGDAVALTLGARSALLPLNRICWGECSEGQQHWDHALFGGGEFGVEGRTEAGFMWRAQAGFWGLLAHGGASCTPDGGYPCYVSDQRPGVVVTQELTLGWAF